MAQASRDGASSTSPAPDDGVPGGGPAGEVGATGAGSDDLLGAVLGAVAAVGTESVTVLDPVREGDHVVDFRVVADSGFTAHLAGRPVAVGRTLREIFPEDFARQLIARNGAVLATGVPDRSELALETGPHGAVLPRPVERGEAPSRIGEVARVASGGRVVVLWRDVTQARAAQRELLATERRFRRLVEHASDPILVTRADGTLTYASPVVGALLDREPATMLGERFGRHFLTPQDAREGQDLLRRARELPQGASARAEGRVVNGDGAVRWVSFVATNWLEDPDVQGLIINSHDVTERRESESRLRRQALTDELTGLPNRRWLIEALHAAVDRSRGTRAPFALLLLDVDDFKVLNDTLGHSAGDRLLVELARRIGSVLGPGESVARLGGDEFVVLVEGLDDVGAAEAVAARVADVAAARHTVGALATHVTLSIGIATWDPAVAADRGAQDLDVLGPARHAAPALAPLTGDPAPTADADAVRAREAEALLAHADAALYEAKRRGRNRVEVFDPLLRERLVHRLHVESELLHALDHDELTVHWQPIVRVRDGATSGVEALVRWRHPGRGLLAAAHFLPVASEVGLMPTMCTVAADAAMAQAARWQAAGDGPEVFINLAAVQLGRPDLADELAELAARHGVAPSRVQFEVAEDVLGADVCRLAEQLARVREHGFRIALDDFGAGNTALTWLRRLPVDTLKLDRDFARTLDEGPTRTVVRSLVRLAADLGIATIAEGVETPEQLEFFAEAGCDHTQGYLHGFAVPADELDPERRAAG